MPPSRTGGFFVRNKIYLVFTIISLITSITLGSLYFASGRTYYQTKKSNLNQPVNNALKSIETGKQANNNGQLTNKNQSQTSSITPNQINETDSQKNDQSIKETSSTNNVLTTLKINTGTRKYSYQVFVEKNSSAYNQLLQASKENRFSIKVKNYSYGAFIDEIHGVANNSLRSTYWLLYINNKLSSVGASDCKIDIGDTIKWVYQKTN